MSAFQWIVTPFCVLQFFLSLRRLKRSRHLFHLAFAGMWLGGAILMVDPNISVWMARSLGIGRGVDLAFYVLCILFLWAHYQHYVRYRRTVDQITTLVREFALLQARTSSSSPASLDASERS